MHLTKVENVTMVDSATVVSKDVSEKVMDR